MAGSGHGGPHDDHVECCPKREKSISQRAALLLVAVELESFAKSCDWAMDKGVLKQWLLRRARELRAGA
jgi:hypothetical protein